MFCDKIEADVIRQSRQLRSVVDFSLDALYLSFSLLPQPACANQTDLSVPNLIITIWINIPACTSFA